MLPELVVASANPDKVKEISSVLDGLVTLIPRPDHVPDVVEDGDTLEDNARLKAQAILKATGIAALRKVQEKQPRRPARLELCIQ